MHCQVVQRRPIEAFGLPAGVCLVKSALKAVAGLAASVSAAVVLVAVGFGVASVAFTDPARTSSPISMHPCGRRRRKSSMWRRSITSGCRRWSVKWMCRPPACRTIRWWPARSFARMERLMPLLCPMGLRRAHRHRLSLPCSRRQMPVILRAPGQGTGRALQVRPRRLPHLPRRWPCRHPFRARPLPATLPTLRIMTAGVLRAIAPGGLTTIPTSLSMADHARPASRPMADRCRLSWRQALFT